MRRLFTFGFGQTDPKTGRALDNRYVWVEGSSVEDCRRQMLDRFGRRYHGAGNWAFDYPDAEAAGVERHRLIEIDLETGGDL